ncbi:MAG: redoxin domain-containing protein [Candidatus Peribacteria bacterium]|nr:MAG: redoxin domain-containing protein [Candidatus Peribacteria bacterium]
MESHKKFVEKQDLGVALISDPELVLHKELGAYGEKKNYGKIVQGVIRSSFVFDSKGKLIGEYKNIKAKGHAERMLGEV